MTGVHRSAIPSSSPDGEQLAWSGDRRPSRSCSSLGRTKYDNKMNGSGCGGSVVKTTADCARTAPDCLDLALVLAWIWSGSGLDLALLVPGLVSLHLRLRPRIQCNSAETKVKCNINCIVFFFFVIKTFSITSLNTFLSFKSY
jgi:hypothetical protein